MRPGWRWKCDVSRAATSGADANGRPVQTSAVKAVSRPCAAGQFDAARHALDAHGLDETLISVAVHVEHAVDVKQGDELRLYGGSPWDGTYKVARVRTLATWQRVLLETVA